MIKFPFLLFRPPNVDSGGSDDPTEDISQDLADLEEDTEKDDEKDEDEEDGEDKDEEEGGEGDEDEEESPIVGEEEDEEEGEEEEEEEEDEGKDKKKEPERDFHGRPTVKAINEKYKGIFKDFPDLRRAYFALPKYEELFADPEQAQEAVGKSREFDELEADLVGKADPTSLIKTLSENNPRALKKLISNFPAAVKEHFEEAYVELARPILEELVYMAAKHGEKTGNKNLQLAARHISNFIWQNGGDIPDVSKRGKAEPTETEKALETERTERASEKFITAVKEVMPQCEDSIRGLLSQNLNGLSTFERRQIVKEARIEIDQKLKKDKSFQISLSRLWERAKTEDYSDSSKERVKNAWLSRARQIAAPIRNRLRQEALDARSGKSTKPDEKDEKKRTFTGSGGQAARSKGRRVLDPKKIDWSKTSDLDILDS